MLDRVVLTSKAPSVLGGRPPDVTVMLPGEPRGKGRPRSRIMRKSSGDQFVQVYTDSKTRGFEDSLKWVAAQAMRGCGPFQSALKLRVTATFSVPTSWPLKRKRAALEDVVRPIVKPDIDNVLKMLDALNGICWTDDKLIVECTVSKHYGVKPGLLIELWKHVGLLL